MNRRLGQQRRLGNDLIDLGFIALAENRREAAATALREGLSLVLAERSIDVLLWAVEGLAALSLDAAMQPGRASARGDDAAES